MKRAPLPRRPISTSSPRFPSRSSTRLAASRGRTGRFSAFIALLLAAHAEEMARDATDLDFLRALGDTVAAMMAIDVLERFVARIAQAAMDLDGEIGRLASKPVAAVIRHRHPLAHLQVLVAVEM